MGPPKKKKLLKKRKREDKSDPAHDLKRRKKIDTSDDMFPRGGGSVLSGIEIRKLQKETEHRLLSEAGGDLQQFLENTERKERKRDKKKKKKKGEPEEVQGVIKGFITPDMSKVKKITTMRSKVRELRSADGYPSCRP
jgi:hypothetical protein